MELARDPRDGPNFAADDAGISRISGRGLAVAVAVALAGAVVALSAVLATTPRGCRYGPWPGRWL